MGKYWSSIGGIRVRNEDKPPPPPPQPRLCKTCGVVVGKGKSFCVDCKKERLVKKRKRVGREYREKYKEYYRQYMKEYDEKRYRQRYCKECDIEVGKRKHYCDECRVKKNKEYNKTYWRNNPYSEWSDEKKKKHSETTKRYFLKNKDKWNEYQRNYTKERMETDKEYRKRVKEYRKNYWRKNNEKTKSKIKQN